MKMEILSSGIEIIPENVQDRIYIEYFLGLKNENEKVQCIRTNAYGLSNIAHIKIIPNKKEE